MNGTRNGSSHDLPSLNALKDQARRLRKSLEADGTTITLSKSLELLAHQYGRKDWNTLSAAAERTPRSLPATVGGRVRGRYLGQAFEADVVGMQSLSTQDRHRITLRFDRPVDVVTFASFSNLRRRISCVIDGAGRSVEKTSDGYPHLELETATR